MAEDTATHSCTYDITVGGTEVTAEEGTSGEINSIRIFMYNDGPDYFELKLYHNKGAEDKESEYKFPSEDVYVMGADVEIKLGYEGTNTALMKGQIARMDANLSTTHPPQFVVAGYDRLHLLTRGRHTKHWEEVKYSDVASQIAGECGLSCDAEATATTHKYISMNNQTYLSFLTDLARRVGYEVNVDDKKLLFKKERSSEGSVATLKYGGDGANMKKVNIRVQTAGQMTKVRVFGWDEAAKAQIIGEAAASDVSPKLGATTTGPELADGIFGEAPFWVSGFVANTQAEVDTAAKSILNDIAHKFVKLDAECEGNADIVPGTVVTIEGCTDRFNGDYYVNEAVHLYEVGGDKGEGYVTRIICSRPGWGI